MTIMAKHQIVIVGGRAAGITVAARMLRTGYTDVAVIEPSSTHYYQPLWTLVGGGQAKASTTERSEASVMPRAGEPSFTLLYPTKPHRAYWYVKKYGLPFMYWNLMLKGLA